MPADEPRVSVLLPVRDAESTLGVCLASVARQTERRFECVIVDDGSSDRSAEIATSLAARDDRFRVLVRPQEGLISALNAGFDACRAPYVARMDADDWMHRERLALQCDSLDREPAWAAVGSHVRLFPRTNLEPGMRRYEFWLSSIDSPRRVEEDAFVECPVAHPSLLLRRSALDAEPYRDEGWPEDYDLVLRLLERGPTVGVVPQRLLAWRQGEQRLSRTHSRYALPRFTECKAHFIARGLLAKSDRYVLWGYGQTGRALARALRSHGKRPERIVEIHPRRIGERILGVPVVPPDALRATDTPLVASVSGLDARTRIRAHLKAMGFREQRDFICAA